MKYSISNITHKSHDVDAETVFFDFEVEIEEPVKHKFKYFYSFSELLRYYIKEYDINLYNYYQSTRKSLTKYGSYEFQTLQHIGDEALHSIYNHLNDYLLVCYWMPLQCEHVLSRMQKPLEERIEEHKQVEKSFEELEPVASAARESGSRQTRFLNLLDKRIHETILEIYPEIVDLEPNMLAKLEHLFNDNVFSCFHKIDKLLHGKE